MKKTALIALCLSFFFGTVQAEEASFSTKALARQRAQQLVPYAVDQAVEAFSKTERGGIMHIAAKSPGDSKQIKLIQVYLIQTAKEYSQGDFSSTERFHGSDMPGLARMKAAKGDISYEYKALNDGGQIQFSTNNPQWLNALHDWIEAQIREHNHAD